MPDTILVVDCGAQYAHLIARGIRRLDVYSELVAPQRLRSKLAENGDDVKGIVISGGPSFVYLKGSPQPRAALKAGKPVLGICYGYQFMGNELGARVRKSDKREYGPADISVDTESALFRGLNSTQRVWMSHGDVVLDVPEGFEPIASSDNSPIAAFGNEDLDMYGVAFHPEVSHTPCGIDILKNFTFGICRCEPNWRTEDYAGNAVRYIEERAGDSRVLAALSGGVDSSTATALGQLAIGGNVIAVCIDNGFMREGEIGEVRRIFTERFPVELYIVDASDEFYGAVRGIRDPERRRNIIGDTFARVFDREMSKHRAGYLMQGTIYPDRIESAQHGAQAARHARRIKTHHNVGTPLIMKFRRRGRLIEPLEDLYKDEVRGIAAYIGLPEEIVYKQPCPGPGLAVRVLGPITRRRIEIERKADAIMREEIEKALPREKRPSQYFPILLDSRMTGVKGDDRAYGYAIALRAVDTDNFMTASASDMPRDLLDRITTRITNEVHGVVRVFYEHTPKPPATIEGL